MDKVTAKPDVSAVMTGKDEAGNVFDIGSIKEGYILNDVVFTENGKVLTKSGKVTQILYATPAVKNDLTKCPCQLENGLEGKLTVDGFVLDASDVFRHDRNLVLIRNLKAIGEIITGEDEPIIYPTIVGTGIDQTKFDSPEIMVGDLDEDGTNYLYMALEPDVTYQGIMYARHAEPQLLASNIVRGATICSVEGEFEPEIVEMGTDTSDGTITSEDVLEGKVAYSQDERIVGTIKSVERSMITPGIEDQIIDKGQYLAGDQVILGDNKLTPENIAEGVEIFNVVGTHKGTDTTDATISSEDVLSGKVAYGKDGKITGTMKTKESEVFTPGTSNIVIEGKQYLEGPQTISGDENLIPDNIKEGETVFGVTGNYKGTDVSDATATSDDILPNTTAYTKDGKVEGTMKTLEGSVYTPGVEDQIIDGKQYLLSDVTISGDENLVSDNIKSGSTIFGVLGNVSVVDTSDANLKDDSILVGYSGYADGKLVEGTMEAIDGDTITPSTEDQTFVGGNYLRSDVVVKGDKNLLAENIKKDVEIFGVTGDYIETELTKIYPDVLVEKQVYTQGSTTEEITVPGMIVGINVLCYRSASPDVYFGRYEGSQVSVRIRYYIAADNFHELGMVTLTSENTVTVATTSNIGQAPYLSSNPATVSIYYMPDVENTPVLDEKEYTPGTEDITIEANQYISGTQTIKGDSNLVAENIKKDIEIFGVTGEYVETEITKLYPDVLCETRTYNTQTADSFSVPGLIVGMVANATLSDNKSAYVLGKYTPYGTPIYPPGSSGDPNRVYMTYRSSTLFVGYTTSDKDVVVSTSSYITSAPTELKVYYVPDVESTPVLEETTYVPGTEDHVIEANQYIRGNQVIKGDENLLPENIRNGVELFGVTGEYIETELTKIYPNVLSVSKVYNTRDINETNTVPGMIVAVYSLAKGGVKPYLAFGRYKGETLTVAMRYDSGGTTWHTLGTVSVVDIDTYTVSVPQTVIGGSSSGSSNVIPSYPTTVTVYYVPTEEGIDTLEATSYTPTTTNQIIPNNKYLVGDQTILGDTNLVPENIKLGTKIFDVLGTYDIEGFVPADLQVATYVHADLSAAGTYNFEVPGIILGIVANATNNTSTTLNSPTFSIGRYNRTTTTSPGGIALRQGTTTYGTVSHTGESTISIKITNSSGLPSNGWIKVYYAVGDYASKTMKDSTYNLDDLAKGSTTEYTMPGPIVGFIYIPDTKNTNGSEDYMFGQYDNILYNSGLSNGKLNLTFFASAGNPRMSYGTIAWTGRNTFSINKGTNSSIPTVSQKTLHVLYYEATDDENLLPENIKKNVMINGTKGTYEGLVTTDATITEDDILEGKTGYGSEGTILTGTIPSKEAAEFTPKTTDQTIEAGQYLSGDQVIKGDANLLAANIKAGVNLFGIKGLYEGIDGVPSLYTLSVGGKRYNDESERTFTVPGPILAVTSSVTGGSTAVTIGRYDNLIIGKNEGSVYTGSNLTGSYSRISDDTVVISGFATDANNCNCITNIIYAMGDPISKTIKKVTHDLSKITTDTTEYTVPGVIVGFVTQSVQTYDTIQNYMFGQYRNIISNTTMSNNGLKLQTNYRQVNTTDTIGYLYWTGKDSYKITGLTMGSPKILNVFYYESDDDPNLLPENIKDGVTINGTVGTLTSLDTSDATITNTDVLAGKIGYGADDTKITGTIESKEAETYTPGTEDITISSGVYLEGDQVISGCAELLPENIRKDVNIFDIIGSYEPETLTTTGLNYKLLDTTVSFAASLTQKETRDIPVDGRILFYQINFGLVTTCSVIGEFGSRSMVSYHGNKSNADITIVNTEPVHTFCSATNTSQQVGSATRTDTSTLSITGLTGYTNNWSARVVIGYTDTDANSDPDLLPENIRSGVDLFHTIGTLVPLPPEEEWIEATEYVPTTEDQTISAEQYLGGDQVIKGSENLLPENILEGIDIFGVMGTLAQTIGITKPVIKVDVISRSGNDDATNNNGVHSYNGKIIGLLILSGNYGYNEKNDLSCWIPDHGQGTIIRRIQYSQLYTTLNGDNWGYFNSFENNALMKISDVTDNSFTLSDAEMQVKQYTIWCYYMEEEQEPNLLPENIKSGVDIFGVTGTFDPEVEMLQMYPGVKYTEFNVADMTYNETVEFEAPGVIVGAMYRLAGSPTMGTSIGSDAFGPTYMFGSYGKEQIKTVLPGDEPIQDYVHLFSRTGTSSGVSTTMIAGIQLTGPYTANVVRLYPSIMSTTGVAPFRVFYLDGEKDENLIPANIKKDVEIFGVVGEYEPTTSTTETSLGVLDIDMFSFETKNAPQEITVPGKITSFLLSISNGNKAMYGGDFDGVNTGTSISLGYGYRSGSYTAGTIEWTGNSTFTVAPFYGSSDNTQNLGHTVHLYVYYISDGTTVDPTPDPEESTEEDVTE